MTLLRSLASQARYWLDRLRGRGKISTVYVDDLPDVLESHTLYIVGESGFHWFAALLCPCGCQETLYLSLHKEGRPRWVVSQHWDGSVSLRPSVRRMVGCQSHFFLTEGRIRWCSSIKLTQ